MISPSIDWLSWSQFLKHDVLLADMLAAGQEERRLAIERKDYHEEVPAITVITDGGWSKSTPDTVLA
jgi:hypothetical protein